MSVLLWRPKAGAPPTPPVAAPRQALQALAEVSFTDPGAPLEWQDITGYLRRFSITRGRSTELDQQQAGVATITLDNRDGRFDPGNTAGAYFPNVKPMRRIRLLAEVVPTITPVPFTMRSSTLRGSGTLRAGTAAIPLFSGFVESWGQTWALSNGDANVTLRVVDGFKIFNLAEWTYGYYYNATTGEVLSNQTGGTLMPLYGPPWIPDDLVGTRINIALDAMAWPEAERDIDPGTVTIWGSDGVTNIPVTTTVLPYLLQAAESEGGLLFMARDGRLRFIDADHLPPPDPKETYGGGTGEIPYADIEIPYDDARLWNDITVETTAPTLTAWADDQDATSIASYYRRKLTITILPVGFATLSARSLALLNRYKEPALRISALSMTTLSEPGKILAHELGDWIRVRKRPAGADMIDQVVRIEGITIENTPGPAPWWSVTWRLSSTQSL